MFQIRQDPHRNISSPGFVSISGFYLHPDHDPIYEKTMKYRIYQQMKCL